MQAFHLKCKRLGVPRFASLVEHAAIKRKAKRVKQPQNGHPHHLGRWESVELRLICISNTSIQHPLSSGHEELTI